MKLEALSLRRTLLLGTAFLTGIAGFAGAASALTLQEAVGLIISTNPEVGVTVKDRRAIDYELRQARALYYPQIDIRLDAGIDFSENETTDTGNARTNQGVHDHGRWLYGRRDAQVTLQQRIFDGFETDSEVDPHSRLDHPPTDQLRIEHREDRIPAEHLERRTGGQQIERLALAERQQPGTGIDVTPGQQDRLDRAVTQAVSWVESRSRRDLLAEVG